MSLHQDNRVSVALMVRVLGVQVSEPFISYLDGMWTVPSHTQGESRVHCMGKHPSLHPTTRQNSGLLVETYFHVWLLLPDLKLCWVWPGCPGYSVVLGLWKAI